jgi:hypothetical protein
MLGKDTDYDILKDPNQTFKFEKFMICEMKNMLHGIKIRLRTIKESINELQDMSIETIQNETEKFNRDSVSCGQPKVAYSTYDSNHQPRRRRRGRRGYREGG